MTAPDPAPAPDADEDAARLLARAAERGIAVPTDRVAPILAGARYLAEATRLLRAEAGHTPDPGQP